MNIGELIEYLVQFPDEMTVKVFDDYGSQYKERNIANIISSREYDEEQPTTAIITLEDENN